MPEEIFFFNIKLDENDALGKVLSRKHKIFLLAIRLLLIRDFLNRYLDTAMNGKEVFGNCSAEKVGRNNSWHRFVRIGQRSRVKNARTYRSIVAPVPSCKGKLSQLTMQPLCRSVFLYTCASAKNH